MDDTTATQEAPEQTDTEAPRALTPVWTPDQTADPEPVEEPATEATDTDATGDEDTQEQPESKPESKHDYDKGLQKLQMRQAAFEKQQQAFQEEMRSQFQELASVLKQEAPPAQTTSPARSEQAEAKVELDELLSELKSDDPDDIPTKAQIERVFRNYAKAFGTSRANPELKSLEETIKAQAEKIASLEGAVDESRQLAYTAAQVEQARAYWADFKKSNGFDGQPLWEQALKEAADDLPDGDGSQQFGAAKVIFNRAVREKKAAPSPKPAAQRPPGTNPPRSTTGVQVTSPGAPATTAARAPAKGGYSCYVED